MTEPPFREPGRAHKRVACVTAIGSLVAAQALAAPESRLQEAPLPVAKVTAGQLANIPSNRNDRAILDLHNALRTQVGARPLRWNPALAANAQGYAGALARTGTVEHASRIGRENERENIVVGARSGISPLQMVQIWIKEKQLFRPGTFPDVCSGDWSQCGHYTQMIWPTTTDIGCGYATGRFDAFVCRYSPPGNKDGVAVGPGALSTDKLAEGLCTTPRGVTIPCQNAPGGVQAGDGPGGGIIQDGGGGDKDDGAKDEEVCIVDVNVHKPISVAPDELVIEDAREIAPGATTLRNDDSDWRLRGEAPAGELPIMTLPTDLDRTGNPDENDLVKVIGLNPNRLPGVYLFAFPIDAEASRALDIQVDPVYDGRQASAEELGYFTAATKPAPPEPGLPVLVPQVKTLWVEGKLGGRYRMVIGKLVDQVAPADVSYDRRTGKAHYTSKVGGKEERKDAFKCEDQATVTAAVVDIFQKNTDNDSLRLTAFDVYWGGRPHFRAEVWPGGQRYVWGEKYRLGAAEHEMPGTAVDDENVAYMLREDEDDKDDPNARVNGPEVDATGTANGSFVTKGRIEGGFQIDTPRTGNVPTIDGTPGNRYPKRVSLAYSVNGDTLVRPEYLEVILPRVRPPAASGPDAGTARVVESKVQYTIVDLYDRVIKAESVGDYLHLYGAGLKAWEALGEQEDRVIERGKTRAKNGQPKPDKYNDHVYLTAAGVDNRANRHPPIGPLGTAQRSQALVREDRMQDGTFKDTLVFTVVNDADIRGALWRGASGRDTRESLDQASAEADARDNALMGRADPREQKMSAAKRQEAEDQRRDAVPAADQRRIVSAPVLAIPQDVILQLRVGTQRHDLMVFQGNTLSVFAPYFFDDNKYQGDKNDPVFRFHLSFRPGSVTSQLVLPPYRRP